MNRSLLLALVACVSTSAFANDGGIAYLQVSKLSAKKNEMTISGESVNKFMKLIPGAAYAADAKYGDYTKSLLFTDGISYMSINCKRGELTMKPDYSTGPVKPVTPTCTFSYTPGNERLGDIQDIVGDGWELNPFEIAKKIMGVR